MKHWYRDTVFSHIAQPYMEVISLWHCWGGMEAQVSLTVAFSSTFGAFGSVGRSQILLENEISIFKKLVSRRKHEVLQYFLVNGCSDVGFQKTQMDQHQQMTLHPNHHRLWKLNTGLQATWAMSFSTLPPDSRTLVSKWNTKLALIWKEDFGPLGNSPVLLLLSPGKTPLMTTVAKFLDIVDRVRPFMTTVYPSSDATSSRIMHHVTKLKSSQTGFLNMTMSSLYSNGLHIHQISIQ